MSAARNGTRRDRQNNFSTDRKRSGSKKRENKLFPERIPDCFRCFYDPEKLSRLFAVIMLGVFPLLLDHSLYRRLTRAKFIYFTAIHLVYFALVAVLCFLLKLKSKLKFKTGSYPKSESEPLSSPEPASKRKKILSEKIIRNCHEIKSITLPQILCFAYMLWACVSSLFSEYGSDVLLGQSRYEGLYTLLMYGTAFILLSRWGSYSPHYVNALSVYAVLESLLCLIQFLSAGMPSAFSFWGTGFLGTLGNVDCVAGINAFVIPALTATAALTEDHRRIPRLTGVFMLSYIQMYACADSGLLGLVVSSAFVLPFLCEDGNRLSGALVSWAVMFLGLGCGKIFPFTEPGKITVSYSLTGTVLLAASVLMLVSARLPAVAAGKPVTEKSRERRRTAGAFAVLIAAAASVLFLYFYRGSHPLLYDAHELLHGRLEDHAGSDRGMIWKYSLELISQRPVFGYGPGTFISAFQPYNDHLHSVGYLKTIDFAHNDFLQIAVCEGVPGLVLYVSFIVSLCVKALGKAGKCPLILIFLAGMTGYLAHSSVSFSIVIVTPGFWVMAGLTDNLIRQSGALISGTGDYRKKVRK